MSHIHAFLQLLLNLPDTAFKSWLAYNQEATMSQKGSALQIRQWRSTDNATQLSTRITELCKDKAVRMSYQSSLTGAMALLDCMAQMLERATLLSPIKIEPTSMAMIWRGRAAVLQHREQYEQSLVAAEEAARIYEEHGKPFDVAVARTGKVFSLGAVGRFDEAIALALSIRPHFEAATYTRGLAILTISLADVYTNLGHHTEALLEYNKALELFASLRDKMSIADVWHSLGILYTQMDRLDLAHEYYERAYPVFFAHDNEIMLVRTQFNRAHCYIRQERYNDALTYIAQARTDLQHLSDSPKTGFIDLAEAQVRQKLHEIAKAKTLLQAALQRFEQVQDRVASVEVLLELGRLLASLERPTERAEGIEYLEQAEIYLQELGTSPFLAWVRLEHAEQLFQLGRIDEAIAKAETASEIFAENQLTLRLAQTQVLLADCYSNLLQDERARHLYQAVLVTIQGVPSWVGIRCWRGLAQLEMAANDSDAAEHAYIQAFEMLDKLRRTLRSHSHQAGFLEDKAKRSLTEALLAALQVKAGNALQVFTWLERFKAIALADLLAEQPPDYSFDQELQVLLQERTELATKMDRCMTALYTRPDSQQAVSQQRSRAIEVQDQSQAQKLIELRRQLQLVDEKIERRRHPATSWREGTQLETPNVHRLLDDNSTLISYYTVDDQLCALTATNIEGDLQVHALPISLTEVANCWKSARRLIQRSNEPTATINEELALLWQYLIAPLETQLQDKKRLIILPHRELFHIPFTCLYDAQNARYLIQQWTIQLAPSATVLSWCRQRPQSTLPPLLVGYPGVWGQADYLRAVKKELKGLSQIVPDASCLFGKYATTSRVLMEMPGRSFVHLAGHAFFNNTAPLESGMPFAGESWLRASDLYLRYGHLQGTTVVLSGCETGRSRMSGGDVLGLTSAFLYAGAAGIVAGLWRVDDTATSLLMTKFYQELMEGIDTAYALRQAQLFLLKNEKYAAPYFWAPFGLNGDSRVIIPPDTKHQSMFENGEL